MPAAYPIYSQPLMAKHIMARAMDTNERPSDSPLPEPIKEFNFLRGVLPAGLTYTNSSTSRVYWDATGTRRSAVANEPIFETMGGVYQGMRWEMEERTNLATNSEGALATWPIRGDVVDAVTPIAGFSASLQFGDNSVTRYAYKSFTTVDATRYTVSVFVQMDDGGAPVVGASSTAGDFSLVIEGDAATLNVTVQHIAGSLYRVSAGRVAVAPITNSNGIVKYTTQSARTFRVAGIQLEAAASASSYIPTAGSAVTRQPDVLTASSISPWYKQSEGTVVFEGVASTPATAQRGMYLFSDGTDNERISGYRASGLNGGVLVVDGGVTQADISTLSSIAQASIFRHALAYKLNDVAGSVNGGTPVVDTSATMPTITALTMGQGNTSGTQAFMGYARRFSYYPKRLPDAMLKGLSRV